MASNTEIAWSFFELESQGRLEEALELLGEDGTWWNVRTRQAVPMSEMKASIPKFLAQVPIRFDLHNAMADGDRVILEMESHAVRADGKEYNNVYCFVITVSGGKIQHAREYLDPRASQELVEFLDS
jgi:ketosteroid isomerase-like protein